MKRIFAALAIILTASAICQATDIESITNDVKYRFPQIYSVEQPIITTSDTPNGDPIYNVHFEKQKITFQYDSRGKITDGTFLNDTHTISDDDIWKLRPDIPRNRMVLYSPDMYMLKSQEGLLDSRVGMVIMHNNDKVNVFSVESHATDAPPPAINITLDDAYRAAKRIAKNWVYTIGDKGYSWPYVFLSDKFLKTAIVVNDSMSEPYIVYIFYFILSNEKSGYLEGQGELPMVCVNINATTGDVVDSRTIFYYDHLGKITTKPAIKLPAVDVVLNANDAKLGFPIIQVKNTTYVAMPTLQSLAKGHTVAAQTGAKAFSLDGKQLALDAKVLDRKGVLYLPWQVLNNLPGIKAEFDAKLAKLIITSAAQNAAAR